MADFINHGVTTRNVQGLSIDEMAETLRTESIMATSQKAVLRAFYLTYGSRGSGRIADPNLNIRVFLAAYMIRQHPTFVFEHQGALETDLIAAAGTLIPYFERLCTDLCTQSIQDIPTAYKMEFPAIMHDYVTKFRAWKIPDEVGRLLRVLCVMCCMPCALRITCCTPCLAHKHQTDLTYFWSHRKNSPPASSTPSKPCTQQNPTWAQTSPQIPHYDKSSSPNRRVCGRSW